MGKSRYLLLAIAVLTASFLYETDTQQKTIKKRTPVDNDGYLTVYKTVGRETATLWKTFRAGGTQTIVETVTETVTETTETAKVTDATETSSPTQEIGEAEYQMLYDSIKQRILANELLGTDLRPKYVRAAFHDLMNFDGTSHGADGCLLIEPARSFTDNADLVGFMGALKSHVEDQFIPLGIAFPLGDIVSMAGKVSIEMAFPCVRPDWQGGRAVCDPDTIVSRGPPGSINSREKLRPFLERYGMTDREMAILTIGAHAVKNSIFVPWIFNGDNSGPKFIDETANGFWQVTNKRSGDIGVTYNI
jgi:hypothetical protein